MRVARPQAVYVRDIPIKREPLSGERGFFTSNRGKFYGGAILSLIGVAFAYLAQDNPSQTTQNTFIEPVQRFEASILPTQLSSKPTQPNPLEGFVPTNKDEWVTESFSRDMTESATYLVQKNDTLSEIFETVGLSQKEAIDLSSLQGAAVLNRLRPGDTLHFEFRQPGKHLESIFYDIDHTSYLVIDNRFGNYSAQTFDHEMTSVTRELTGTIEDSLFNAGQKAGLSDSQIMELAGIFQWNIDFAQELLPGDHFSVIVEDIKRVDGKPIDSKIMAAEINVNGRSYRAIRHQVSEDSVAYYTPQGDSLKRAFIRTPLPFYRVSSKFSKGRYHPILKRWRSHKGVDYAAPTGTPIYAAGNGKIVHLGRKGGYGKTIILQHANQYSTLYGHMTRYRKDLRRGQRVKQGETIGYVGSTGLATGPHLHYEFRIAGQHKNPLSVKLPNSAPIQADQRDTFVKTAAIWSARLDTLSQTRVAEKSEFTSSEKS